MALDAWLASYENDGVFMKTMDNINIQA